MIKKVSLENFKAFKKAEIELKPITILLGPNSGGKSSILKSILLIKQTLEKGEDQPLNLGHNFGNFEDILHQDNSEKGIRFKFDFNNKKFLSFRITKDDDNLLLVTDYSYNSGTVKFSAEGITSINRDSEYFGNYYSRSFFFKNNLSYSKNNLFEHLPLILERKKFFYTFGNLLEGKDETQCLEQIIDKIYSDKDLLTIDRSKIEYIFYRILKSYSEIQEHSNNFPINVKAEFKQINYIGPIRPSAEREYDEITSTNSFYLQPIVVNKNLLEKIIEILTDFNLLNDIKILPIDNESKFQLRIKTDITKTGVNFADTGFGTSQILPIVLQTALSNKNTLLMIEQPEVHLHPRIQADLGNFFVDNIKLGKNFLIETHSEYLVERIKTLIMEKPQLRDKVKIYYVDQNKEKSCSEIKEIKMNSVGEFVETPEGYLSNISLWEIERQLRIKIERLKKGE